MEMSATGAMVIWRLIDGKPGHENQTLGLVNALKRFTRCECIDIPVDGAGNALVHYMTASWPAGMALVKPDLILGAGHATHLHLLAARRAYGGKTIVLMQPSLPVAWFDLCLIPEHDQYQGSGSFIETKGVLNTIRPDGEHAAARALIMIGGECRHFAWDDEKVAYQVQQLVSHHPATQFTLTTSRRTPKSFLAILNVVTPHNLEVVPFEATTPGWVAAKLAQSSTAWITEDSVSMVYEALTAQVAVGILNLETARESRVSRGLKKLINRNLVVPFNYAGTYRNALKPVPGFAEADRCAHWIMHRWFSQPVLSNIPAGAQAW